MTKKMSCPTTGAVSTGMSTRRCEAARRAIEVGHFRADLDTELFAFQMLGIALSRHQAMRLLHDPGADAKSRRAFAALLAESRA